MNYFPTSILLEPAEGDPIGFLAERSAETEPVIIAPQGYRAANANWAPYDPRVRPPYGSLHPFALALAWDAKVLPDGVSRAINAGLPPRWGQMWVRFAACERRHFTSSYGWLQGLSDAHLVEQSSLIYRAGDPVLTKEAEKTLRAVDPMCVPLDIRSTYLLACVLQTLHGGSVVLLGRDRKEMR